MRDLEWLKEEVNKLDTEESQRYPHWEAIWKAEVLELIDQVEQPDYDEIFDEGYKSGYRTGKNHVPRQPDLPEIPSRVAELIEHKKHMHYGIGSVFVEVENSRQVLTNDSLHLEWIIENQDTFAQAYLFGYTIEEKKYKVEVIDDWGGMFYLNRYNNKVMSAVSERSFDTEADDFKLTEQEIKDYDSRYWPFAVEVED